MVDFKNIVVIMMLNIGLFYLFEGIDVGGEIMEMVCKQVNVELCVYFCFEFFNCVDDIVFFKLLMFEEIEQIVDLFVVGFSVCFSECNFGLYLVDDV